MFDKNDRPEIKPYIKSYADRLKEVRRRKNNKLALAVAPQLAGSAAGSGIGIAAGQKLGTALASKVAPQAVEEITRKGFRGNIKTSKALKGKYALGARVAGGVIGGTIGNRLALPLTQRNVLNALRLDRKEQNLLTPTKKELQQAMADPNIGNIIRSAQALKPSINLPSRYDIDRFGRTLGFNTAQSMINRERNY
jgi:hypothetical protein